ncbi:MAG TPA: right-handed parallel beta-helix repeat-containing protein [Edaphocola sp.]|nr:right-handed parallel beta-helix repeat-containing protein [Edaphocola sp.]
MIGLLAMNTSSCRKLSKTIDQGNISFSADTLLFDTVFTTQGTSTRMVKIYNNEKERINITSIRLFRGNGSPYFINVNGQSGKEVHDITIEGNDSIYVFASVLINPGQQDDPFIVEDRIIATVGTQDFNLPVIGYGQDAIYITDSVINTQTWTSNKPYVIIKNAWVDEGQTLTIQAGTKVFVHADSRLFVAGTLKIKGTKEDIVVFQGDRIDRRIYFDPEDFNNGVGGEWGGLYFTQSSYNNQIDYALFKNGGAVTNIFDTISVMGATIQVDRDTLGGTPKLTMTNSTIRNSGGYGVLSFGGSIKAENCLFFGSILENLAFIEGGNYSVLGCTITGFTPRASSATESHYCVAATDFFKVGNQPAIWSKLTAIFRNCIIYGNGQDELFLNSLENSPSLPNVTVENCLIKKKKDFPVWANIANNNIFNLDPEFEKTATNNFSIADDDYHLLAESPAKGAGMSFSGMLPNDMEGNPRANPPSIGCFE